jgi:hypothetical protein
MDEGDAASLNVGEARTLIGAHRAKCARLAAIWDSGDVDAIFKAGAEASDA